MQQIVIYWQSVVPQHFYRASLRPSSGGQTAFHCLWFLSRCSCCDAGDSGSKMCALWGGCCLLSQDVCTVRRMLLVESSKMCALWGGCCLLSQARCVHSEENVACWVKQDVCTVRRMLLVESSKVWALWGGCCLLSQARCVHCEEDVACWVKHPSHSAHIFSPDSPASQQLQQDRKP